MDTIRVAVTGYCATGSSAVIDLLREYDGMDIAIKNGYEHVVFYMPDGLFDLEDKLLRNNDPHRSDEAIRSFRAAMERLYKQNFGWFGSYKACLGPAFMEAVDDFIGQISTVEPSGLWYGRYRRVRFSLIKVGLQLAAKIVYKRPVAKWGRQYVVEKGPMYFATPTPQEFYRHGGCLARRYLELSGSGPTGAIYDHLLWPSQLGRMEAYFGDTLKSLVLTRDPRDVFLMSKYIYPNPPILSPTPYPTEARAFCEYWKSLRRYDPDMDSLPNVMRVQFEDLIYRYEDTVGEIETFLGLDPAKHQARRFLDPSHSIVNTQLKLINPAWAEEVRVIEDELPEYLYAFPPKEAASLHDVLYAGTDLFEET